MGTLMLIGGGVASSDPKRQRLFEHMRQAAGGETPRLAILSSSIKDVQTVYDHFYKVEPKVGSFEINYRTLGFEPVFIPLAVDNAEVVKNDPKWAEVLAKCDGAYLQGGNQYNHVMSLLNRDGSPSLLLDALSTILNRGGVVAGTSAGMAAMGDVAFGEGTSKGALHANGLEWRTVSQLYDVDALITAVPYNNLAVQGIGLVPHGILLDTHFDKRGRLGRLMIAMRDTNSMYGIGVDERTCLSLRDMKGEVIGEHGVFIIDASQAVFLKGSHFAVKNLKVFYLTEGDQFDFSSGKAFEGCGEVLIDETEISEVIAEDCEIKIRFIKRAHDSKSRENEAVELFMDVF